MLRLIHTDGTPVKEGDTVTDFRGDTATVTGWQVPRHEGSTGRVYVREGETTGAYFPSVYGLKWQEDRAESERGAREEVHRA